MVEFLYGLSEERFRGCGDKKMCVYYARVRMMDGVESPSLTVCENEEKMGGFGLKWLSRPPVLNIMKKIRESITG